MDIELLLYPLSSDTERRLKERRNPIPLNSQKNYQSSINPASKYPPFINPSMDTFDVICSPNSSIRRKSTGGSSSSQTKSDRYEHNPPNQPSQQRRKSSVTTKKRATPKQLQYLQRTFETNKFPTTTQKTEIAVLIDMNSHAVSVWFQNRRQSE